MTRSKIITHLITSLKPRRSHRRKPQHHITPRQCCWLADSVAITWLIAQWHQHTQPSWLTVLVGALVGAGTMLLVLTERRAPRRRRSRSTSRGRTSSRGRAQQGRPVVQVGEVPELRGQGASRVKRSIWDELTLEDAAAEPEGEAPEYNVRPYATVEEHQQHLRDSLR